ncbi:MAG: Lar family restriction alleviation protein [Lachnospiraceae bacterium]|nr:Lar family restriction alleviation protein [Lachnospiraceae bacterium]MBR6850458.1 Lar family restriction alleviation protein [Lachnospiraceae bacterium]
MMERTVTAKECPFCHIKGERITVKSRYRKGTAGKLMYWVECGYCGAFQPHDDLHGFRTPEKAIEKWNKVSTEHSKGE